MTIAVEGTILPAPKTKKSAVIIRTNPMGVSPIWVKKKIGMEAVNTVNVKTLDLPYLSAIRPMKGEENTVNAPPIR